MRNLTSLGIALGLAGGLGLVQVGPVVAQTTISDAECQGLRQRLADHARQSDGVRRALGIQAGAGASAPPASASAPVSRPEAIRTRLEQVKKERQTLDEQRLGAVVKFDLARATQIQAQIQALDAEKASLEREQAALPASAGAASTPAAPPAAADPIAGIRCAALPAAVDSAVKTRRRELGARDDQAGAIPLIGPKTQTAEQIAQELAGQFAPGAAAGGQVGLLDADGNGQLDGVVDAPAPGVFRLVRQRADGTLAVEALPTGTAGTGAAYGEMARRLDETTLRQTGQKLADVLAIRPAGPARATQTSDFAAVQAQLLAGSFAEAARIRVAAARSTEFPNLRGERVRVLEIISPVTGGVSVRRTVVIAASGDQEVWEETTTTIVPSSPWRSDVEVTRRGETRTTSGAPVGTPVSPAPVKFSLER
jgi:hypothetical protein